MPGLLSATIVMAALPAILHAQNLLSFESFVELHGRTYHKGSAEFEQRKALYDQRKTESEVHNSLPTRIWTAGVNKLWDWTESELQTLRGWDGSMRPGDGSRRAVRQHATFLQNKADLPKEKIWSNLAMSQRIKNQGDCGSCWAIAAASVLEAHYEIYKGSPRFFSAQQIVACTPNPRHCGGDGGCKGATAELAMDWVMKNGCPEESDASLYGVCSTGDPGFAMAQLHTANIAAPTTVESLGMTGWETLPKNTYEPLARALAERGPVAVSVAADAWFNYESGIFNNCGKDAIIDHAVVALGYGEEAGHKYWVIQNSWGQDWGENGHIRLERHDADEYCGMNNDPQKGVACEGETQPVPVCGMCGVLFDSVVPHFQ